MLGYELPDGDVLNEIMNIIHAKGEDIQRTIKKARQASRGARSGPPVTGATKGSVALIGGAYGVAVIGEGRYRGMHNHKAQ